MATEIMLDAELLMTEICGGYTMDEPNSDRAKRRAEEEGLTVVVAKPNQLLIDLDTQEDFELFKKQFETYKRYFPGATFVEAWSKSGEPHRHITVTLPYKITNTVRILLQLCLGSDRVRELLSWIMEMNGDASPTLFLEKPPQAALPASQEPAGLLTEGQA